MTWHAPHEQLVLQGKEAELFREAILYMCDLICDAEGSCSFGGATVFDEMTSTQQFASLEKVAQHLFHATDTPLALSAWSEATLATILQTIRTFVLNEIGAGDSDEMRTEVHKVFDDLWDEADDWDNASDWECCFDAYESRFLWDNDYEDTKVADLPPEQAAELRKMQGINAEYFAEAPPDLVDDWELRYGCKRMAIAIDGKKTIKMTVTLTVDVPESIPINKANEGYQTINGCFPTVCIMQDIGNGNANEANEILYNFFYDGDSIEDHWIEEVSEGE